MQISNGTIDLRLWVNGRNDGESTDSYSDFQHHHWTMMPSSTITSAAGYNSSYIWTLNEQGHDAFGSWSAINRRLTLSAQVRINSSNMVTVAQLTPTNNVVQAIGRNGHWVSEQTWPADLTWSSSAPTPSSIIFQDPGAQTYSILTSPIAPPRHSLRYFSALPSMGFRGRIWTTATQWYQKPKYVKATAWWAWNINLIP
jgi:hypothetical protein